MLINYLRIGIVTFFYFLPVAFIIFCIFTGIKFLIKRNFKFELLIMLCEFAWILTVLAIFKITGIIGGNFGTDFNT